MATLVTRRILLLAVAALAAWGTSLANGDEDTRSNAATAGCKGRVAVVQLPRDRYPNIADHIEDSWAKGYPRVLRVNRIGKEQRRNALLNSAAGLRKWPPRSTEDRDEAPAAVLRSTVRADVRYIDDRENQAAGAKLGAELRGLRNGTCVRYDFGGR